ncbi:MAG: DUF2784 family protein [Candidatus Aenigmatarchaeota archaeon]
MKNKIFIYIANLIFLFHVFWVLYVIIGLFYRYPGIFWDIHLYMSIGLLIGVILNECPITAIERWVRKKGGEKLINRGSRFLEVLKKYIGISLPNYVMRILGFIYFLLGVIAHIIKY